MFNIVSEFVDFIYKAVVTYAASDEGRKELDDIAQAVENIGIDLPFWQPDGEQLNVEDREGATDRSMSFKDRHPELFPNEQGGIQ